MLITQSLLLIAGAAQAYAGVISKRATYAPQFSPTFPNVATPTGVVTSYNSGPYSSPASLSSTGLTGFPETWKTPSTTSSEVEAAYNKIDWSQVPAAPVRKTDSDGNIVINNNSGDKYCWWSDTNCVKPKVSYLPADYSTCKNEGDWGLTYDDGPFFDPGNDYAEPNLYNFLLQTNQKATLFYIGSNVVAYPAAAKLALNDGHQICVHTYSHPPMTTLTNIEVVSELYWSLKAIKAATGVTSKCWRPPQGDVDDRVRAIAWQMGMHTVLWDLDTNDWDMPAPGGGSLPPATVDGYFQSWIDNEKAGNYKTGHIVLEHELNYATVEMTEKWMSKIQATFNVIPALACNGVTQPYWETEFVYPTVNSRPTGTATRTTTTTKTSTTNTSTTAAPSSTCVAGSSGLGNGDGYNGYCCKTQADCIDDCISGKCNGPTNTKTTTTKKATTTTTKTTTTTNKATTTTPKTTTTTKTSTTAAPSATCVAGSSGLGNGDGYNGYCCKTQADCIDDCISGKCNGPTNTKTTTTKKATTTTTKKTTTTTTKTTTKSSTKTTTKAASTGTCAAGYSGKKNGGGPTGACCTSSDDCKETCRSGVCGL